MDQEEEEDFGERQLISDWVLLFLNPPFLGRVLPPDALVLGKRMRAPPLPLVALCWGPVLGLA